MVFGTLAQRSPTSAGAIGALLEVARWRVFDANLRAPHDAQAIALDSLRHADFVKLNETEVLRYAGWLEVAPSASAVREALLTR